MSRSRVTVAMLGARRHYAVPRLLYEADLLDIFYTDSYIGNKPWLKRILKAIPAGSRPRAVKSWLGRTDEVLPPERIVSFEGLGIWYAWARTRAKTRLRREKIFLEAARRFADCIAAKKAGDLKMLWGFNGAALELFRSAKASGGVCILEQTILPARIAMRLLREELERWPDWEPGFDDIEGDAVIIEREEEEWKLADCIVAGSQFVRSGLMECGVPETKIRIVPYGVDSRMFARPERKNAGNDNGRLKVLFAGAVGLRKGAPDLLDALIRLGPEKVEARFAGPIALDRGKIEPYKAVAAFLGPVPRSQMADLYHWADVFVLPSIVEGSATVCYEALMAGLPVITTPNAGTIVRDGIDGFIIPIRKSDTLAKIIANYQQDRPLLDRHKFSAIESRERVSLDRYKTGLIEVLLDLQAS